MSDRCPQKLYKNTHTHKLHQPNPAPHQNVIFFIEN